MEKALVLERRFDTEEELGKLALLLSSQLRAGDIVKITGELGSGKTTLVRALVGVFGGDEAQVHSPTFALVHHYCTAKIPIIHCDFYRLPNDSGLDELGGVEFFDAPVLFLVEWPERAKSILSTTPNRSIGVDLRLDANGRVATISALQ